MESRTVAIVPDRQAEGGKMWLVSLNLIQFHFQSAAVVTKSLELVWKNAFSFFFFVLMTTVIFFFPFTIK